MAPLSLSAFLLDYKNPNETLMISGNKEFLHLLSHLTSLDNDSFLKGHF
ncbi:rCG35835 [Rattus norvegicus]|uniref:RCG35835 n=1 Tax=Rattus norvegicus TaxID=10116 RepID=A6IJK7_RAT|nr:rCG35835 [Rattus norvegicus]